MSAREPGAVVRALTAAFSEAEFASFRDTLAQASSFEEAAAAVGELGEVMRETIDPDVEIHLHDINAASMVGRDFHGWARGRGSGVEVKDHITQAFTVRDGKVTRLGMYASRRSALEDLGHG